MPDSYWIETLGCPKNEVDSAYIAGTLAEQGYLPAGSVEAADLVVVNTSAFIESARAESIETILALSSTRRHDARLVVTGCLAARAGAELAAALPEVDLVADVGVPVTITGGPRWRAAGSRLPSLDLLKVPRPPASAPWAYVKIAEGCDRACGFSAIPSFRGPQASREEADILAEVDRLGVKEVILVAQDLASYGRDLSRPGALVPLVVTVAQRATWVRLLYLYPAQLNDALVEAIVATGVPYFDLSLQHVSTPLLRRMRRFGNAERFLERIAMIRDLAPDAALRSSFILGYPGETEDDHDELLGFIAAAELDWVGLFPFSEEEGTYAATLPDKVPAALALERLREASELQDAITARRRSALVGSEMTVLVDSPGVARSYREAPDIDGVVRVPLSLEPGHFARVRVERSEGPDLIALEVLGAGNKPRPAEQVLV